MLIKCVSQFLAPSKQLVYFVSCFVWRCFVNADAEQTSAVPRGQEDSSLGGGGVSGWCQKSGNESNGRFTGRTRVICECSPASELKLHKERSCVRPKLAESFLVLFFVFVFFIEESNSEQGSWWKMGVVTITKGSKWLLPCWVAS